MTLAFTNGDLKSKQVLDRCWIDVLVIVLGFLKLTYKLYVPVLKTDTLHMFLVNVLSFRVIIHVLIFNIDCNIIFFQYVAIS